MLQSGMRAPMGVKVQGPDLETIEEAGLQIEKLLKQVPSIKAATVIADRIVGKPYLEIVPDRKALARYGVPIRKFQDVVEIAIGGKKVTNTVEGRERFPVRVRYQRELRDNIEALERILVPGTNGQQIPITELAEIRYVSSQPWPFPASAMCGFYAEAVNRNCGSTLTLPVCRAKGVRPRIIWPP